MEDNSEINSKVTKLQELKEGLSNIKVLEAELAGSKWNEDPSPTSVADFQDSLLKRYQEAKSTYMKRRLQGFMVEHISEFDENTNQFDIPDVPGMTKAASGDSSDSGSVDDDQTTNIKEKHAKAIAALEAAAHGVHATLSNIRNSYQTVISRRKELEQMVHDLQQDDENADDSAVESEMIIDNEDCDVEREKTERLQQRKRELQEEYARLVKAKEERMESISQSREELALLQREEVKVTNVEQDASKFKEKIKELKEMKEFYVSLREVMEELGGVKILNAKEDTTSRHVFLTLAIYESHQIEVELEIYRKTMLKLVSAKWLTSPVVTSVFEENGPDGDKKQEHFSLPMDPLDDLVQTAKTSMGPPHDLRFIIRETCARIRFLQNRVDDLAILRRRVLTKVIGNDQVVCSLNEGIVIVMRLYDQWVKVEQIVGVSGWEQSATEKIQSVVSRKEESWTPNKVVDLVQKEIERLQTKDGLVLPKTPVLPIRRMDQVNRESD